ncbi:DUF2285 domain-containing protein [Acidocella aromatica]|uniref:T6SS Transcription factor RovC-like DNA binding domain-containing protein n=1 Tax=Acidocella aromatica TaxID=1303579 RepID=A0A840VPD7_9PROT|nr:DUF2285 domain-containing protein [Acidocella aromatica]MBB5373999.1 hypothetical protein [Acidocella aromatica]
MSQDDTSVVVLTSAPAVFVHASDHPSLSPDGSEENDEQGAHAMVSLGNGERIQVLTTGSGPVAAVVPLDIEGFDRLEAVHRLLAAIHHRVVPPDTRLTLQQRARAQRMLQAFDGSRDGATQQDIAQVIFRIGHVNRDEWQTSSARHAVMSLLRDARALIAGGYRKLLRHRRQS